MLKKLKELAEASIQLEIDNGGRVSNIGVDPKTVLELIAVVEAAQEAYQVLCIEYGYRKAEVNFGYLGEALNDLE